MNRSAEIPWIHFGALSNLWHEHRSTMRGHWLSVFYHISPKREKSRVFVRFLTWYIFWSLYHLVWCMWFQFRFLWLRKWLPNWFAGTRFIKVIALCWSQGNWQSRKVSFSVIFLFVALLQLYYIKIYLDVPSQARLCNSVWVLSMWFVYNATATLVKIIYKSTFCPW